MSVLGLSVTWEGEFAERMVITAVDPGGPADAAGLQPGDTVVALDGRQPVLWLKHSPRLGSARVELLRDGKTLTLVLDLSGPPPSFASDSTASERARSAASPLFLALNAALTGLQGTAARLEARGVSVTGIDAAVTAIRQRRNDCDEELIVDRLYGLQTVTPHFERVAKLVCCQDKPPAEDLAYVEPAATRVLAHLRAIEAVVLDAEPTSSTRRRTQFAGIGPIFVRRFDESIPAMGGIMPKGAPQLLGGRLTQQIGTAPPRRQPPPTGGGLRWFSTSGDNRRDPAPRGAPGQDTASAAA
jgi:hypothetical protein